MLDLFDPLCRYEGEAVAAVAAETPYQAADALKALDVEYEILPRVVDHRDALASDAARVHESGNQVGELSTYERGDVTAGFAEADAVVEMAFETACEIHTPLELHGCVAQWDGDRLTLWESTQGVYRVQSQVARILGMPLSRVRVIGHYVGGGFGSKLQAGKYTVIAALLAKLTARPVKLFLSREETFLCAGNRPPNTMKLKAGARKDGSLVALDFAFEGTGGAYPAGGISLVDWLVRDLYTCPHVRCQGQDIYVNAGPARPFRAPGHPQGAWALEQVMDALAEKLAMDPVALRLQNVPEFSQAREGNPPYTTTGLKACLERGAAAFGWEEAVARVRAQAPDLTVRRGVGMASCLWIVGGGGPPSTVIVKLFADGSVNLNMGASDIGTGTKTVMALVVAEELGVDPDLIEIEHADTGTTQFATPSGGSKTVPTESPAVRAAAREVKNQLTRLAAEHLETDAENLVFEDQVIRVRDDPEKKVAISEVPGLRRQGVIVGVGYRGPNPDGKVVNPFAAQFCEVEVNTRTGEIRVVRFVAAQESGRVLDRLTFDNQVYGGVTMGIGFGLTEERILDRTRTGKMVNRNWHDYKVPTMMDVPVAIESVPVDLGDTECNTTGAKGLGEPVTIPTAAAIANAVCAATGVRMTTTPITPDRVITALNAERKEG